MPEFERFDETITKINQMFQSQPLQGEHCYQGTHVCRKPVLNYQLKVSNYFFSEVIRPYYIIHCFTRILIFFLAFCIFSSLFHSRF